MEFLLICIPLYIMVGALAGIFSGLLGIGGGVITVPALSLIFTLSGFPKEYVMHVAIGTSLSSMAVNTFSATYFHHKKQGVVWKIIRRLLPGIVLGTVCGAFLSTKVSSDFLEDLFGGFACLIGLFFAKRFQPIEGESTLPGLVFLSAVGWSVACLANLLGIGGGMFMLPIFLYFHIQEKKAVATSSAVSFLISLGGAISYFLSSRKGLEISGCLGSVYLPAFFLISASSFFASSYGVSLAHKLPSSTLRKVFAAMMVCVGLWMIWN